MVQVFVYEYTCARRPVGRAGVDSLRVEGWAMLEAVLTDFARLEAVRTVTLLGEEGTRTPPNVTVYRPGAAGEAKTFRDLAAAADFTLVIAPECGGLLAERCRWVEEVGGKLLGPGSAAVEVTGDKLRMARLWEGRGVPTPPCFLGRSAGLVDFPAVLKPRHGAGSQATFLVSNRHELSHCLGEARIEGEKGELLLQPFVPGRLASVAFLVGSEQVVALPPAKQILSGDGRFRYLGGRVPLPAGLRERAVCLGRRAVDAVAGMNGYVGVDLVLGEADDGREDFAIEINPRLTTSYVGLRALAADNLAAALLHVVRGEDVGELAWHPGVVAFTADGRATRREG